MFENGFEPGIVFRHPVFLATYIVAIPAWLIAFAGQCAAEAKYGTTNGTPVSGTLWFAIWVQLAIIIHLFLALATDQLVVHRFQLAVLTTIAVVFAVFGTEYIFQKQGAFIAIGVGWLLTAMVDLVWLLYLTSEEDSTFYRILTSGGTGGLSSPGRRSRTSSRGARRDSATAGLAGGENGLGGGISNMGMSRGISSNNMNGGGGYPMGGYASAPVDTTPQKQHIQARDDYGNASPGGSDEMAYRHKAKAMYAYSASPDDPNEVSFAKGDLLEVVDATGKWYQVRTPSGATGIAPSNYLTML